MGSGQSTPVGNVDHSATISAIPAGKVEIDPIAAENTPVKKKKKKRDKKSVDYQCRKQKRAWSQCVSEHYQKKFLPGKSLEPEEDCDDLFENFRDCYMRGMMTQRQEKGMAPPAKDSMLHEYMVEEGMVEDE